MNQEIEKVAWEEDVTFLNLSEIISGKVGEFEDLEEEIFAIHLSSKGNQATIEEIDNRLREDGIRFLNKRQQVFRRRWPNREGA